MKVRRIFTMVKMELTRQIKDPLVLVFTTFLVPVMIVLFGLTMNNQPAWDTEHSVFIHMVPGLLVYASILTIYDVASSIAGERELGLQKRLNTTPLTTAEYIGSQIITYSVKPLVQFGLGYGIAYALGYRPELTFVRYLLAIVFLLLITFCSVGFGLITAHLAKSASAAGGLAFAFIVPQQIFSSIIPPWVMGLDKVAKAMPSYYAQDSLYFYIFNTAESLTNPTLWMNFGILLAISVGVYIIGIIVYEKMKNK
ncbi:MAG: ABC transporter permease [Gammaproteobacteria bacterium]|nr:ABC transporter permease [Gammaproteobacteria bacterium]